MPDIDQSVIESLRRGEDRAYKAVIDALLGPVHGFLARLCRDRSLAEDLTQETFVAVWQSINSFRGDSTFRTWVFGIARHQLLRHRSRRSPQTVPLIGDPPGDDSADPHAVLQEALDRHRVRTAVDGLPDRYRELLCLVHLGGLSYREAAGVLGIPIGTVKSRMSAAFKLLRDQLAGSEVGSDEVRESKSLSGR